MRCNRPSAGLRNDRSRAENRDRTASSQSSRRPIRKTVRGATAEGKSVPYCPSENRVSSLPSLEQSLSRLGARNSPLLWLPSAEHRPCTAAQIGKVLGELPRANYDARAQERSRFEFGNWPLRTKLLYR